ncbi:MAG: GntR family transcriptional regulator [Acidobacteriota bacterium]|jgi:DNA-binding transcriptional regulator YhcF (GntR family)
MIVRIDADNPIPPYRQLVDQLLTSIAGGTLAVGQRLPPVRQLAADLGLANGTVARAYRLLEEAGVLETRGRQGTFVARQHQGLSEEQRLEVLRAKTAELIQAAAAVGASEGDVKRAVDRALAATPLLES